ncbi:nuclear transport factor 2 family protein [Amycolatopsis sp. NPDC059021]|uniref:nuclear transport factor 2 family protein n=1 Tax=Amycolatopsis sp. NPDC059021 TaxID=3346704 RepID=UPI00366F9B4D
MTTPREVFDQLSDGITAARWDELSALYAEDTVVEHPQQPPVPGRIEGRDALHERFTSPLAASLRLHRHDTVVHETTDPEVIVAEWAYSGKALNTGKTFEAANIQMLRVRDGLITHSRDYHDFLKFAVAQDAFDALKAGFADATRETTPLPPRPASDAAPDSPRGVFERLVYGVSDGRWAELPDLYAPETHVTHPFLPGAPVLRSRDDLREHFSIGSTMEIDIEARDLVTHQSTDPEVVIGEFAYQGRAGIGTAFQVANVFVLRVRNGLIVESRDYGDHLALAAATSRLDDLAARAAA